MKLVVWALLILNVLLLAYFNLAGTSSPEMLTSRQPVQPEKIRLLTEKDIEALPKKAAASEAPLSQAEEVTAPPRTACYEWGSFSRNRLSSARNIINSFSLDTTVKEQSRQEALRYWVYIPPIQSSEKAQEKMEELKLQGIADIFLVQEPQWKNAISFGIFKDEHLATKLLEELRAHGITGAVKGVRNQEKGRVSLLISNMSPDNAAEIEKLKPDFPGSEIKEVICQ